MSREINNIEFFALVGNDEETWMDYTTNQNQTEETSHYVSNGLSLRSVTNTIFNATRYFVD